jgi:hypothetical protein
MANMDQLAAVLVVIVRTFGLWFCEFCCMLWSIVFWYAGFENMGYDRSVWRFVLAWMCIAWFVFSCYWRSLNEWHYIVGTIMRVKKAWHLHSESIVLKPMNDWTSLALIFTELVDYMKHLSEQDIVVESMLTFFYCNEKGEACKFSLRPENVSQGKFTFLLDYMQ